MITPDYLDELYGRFAATPRVSLDPASIQYEDHFDSHKFVTDPLVTVKVVTYNHERLLARALRQIVRQRVSFPFEVIISDDCSSDRTGEIARQFLSEHPGCVRYTRTRKNETAKVNARIGDLLARGKYIAVCEGDDYWHDLDKLQLQVDALEKNADCVVEHCRVRNQLGVEPDAKYSTVGKRRLPEGPQYDLTFPMLQQRYGVNNCSGFYRRQAIERAIELVRPLVDTRQFIQADVPRYLGLSRLGGFYFVDREMATYQVLPESLSRSAAPARRQAIEFSAAFLRIWFIRLVLNDHSFADAYLRQFLVKQYYSREPALSRWAERKLDAMNAPLQWQERAYRPVHLLKRFVRRINRWRQPARMASGGS
jgi:glycosyltransferase involved in cell wall biosynthesis